MKKLLIVYYSWSCGNTERTAKALQSVAGGDLVRLDTAVPYTGSYRTATAASAITAVVTILLCVTSPANSAASSAVTALIIAMFAHSEHHCSATLPAIYFLLSGTAPMSRLLTIIRKSPAFRWSFS